MDIGQLQFNLSEMLSLLGLAQCVYVLTYIGLRAGDMRRAILPLIYFAVLGVAFFLDFGTRFVGGGAYYRLAEWAAWALGPPISVLLVIQIAQISRAPALVHFWVLLLAPLLEWCRYFLRTRIDPRLHSGRTTLGPRYTRASAMCLKDIYATPFINYIDGLRGVP